MQTHNRKLKHSAGTAILSFAIVFAAGAIGSAATIPNIASWYAFLNKPAFTPPNWLFGPAWTLLYILMAIAFYRILSLPRGLEGKKSSIAWFIVQICLNALWSIAFFGMHSPAFGLAVIGLLLVAIVITMVRFFRADRPAGYLLVPYLLWVSFASALNASVFIMNR